MGSILFVSPRSAIPDSIGLINRTIKRAPLNDALSQIQLCDALIVGGNDDLAWARTATTALRGARDDVPILILVQPSALSVLNADWGFTDFVLTTAEPSEIDARLRLLERNPDDAAVLTLGPLKIDEAAYVVTLAGASLDLTYTEFELLRFLAHHDGKVLSRETLLSQVWGYDYYGGTRTVDVHVRRLRAKLGQHDFLIGTVRNVGYRFTSTRQG